MQNSGVGIKMLLLNEPDFCGVAASYLSHSGVFVSSDRQILSVDRRHHLWKKTLRSVLPSWGRDTVVSVGF